MIHCKKKKKIGNVTQCNGQQCDTLDGLTLGNAIVILNNFKTIVVKTQL